MIYGGSREFDSSLAYPLPATHLTVSEREKSKDDFSSAKQMVGAEKCNCYIGFSETIYSAAYRKE